MDDTPRADPCELCPYNAIRGTRRCLQHTEAASATRHGNHVSYGGTYNHNYLVKEDPEIEPVTVEARPYGPVVGFEEPEPARPGWLVRAIRRWFG
ncbi:hypothetical protein [Amycolatopsis pigmentata]|uniref:Uncharacterized protein n=1 Tax=Amycolatopsis pigmentata TaxID=450801 RepID=A0ABW5G4V2_9PSEU